MQFFRVVQVRPSDWDRRVEIVKDHTKDLWWSFRYCRNCNEVIEPNEFEEGGPITGETLKCPRCHKIIIKWETSKDISFESLVEPGAKGFKIVERNTWPQPAVPWSVTAPEIMHNYWSNTDNTATASSEVYRVKGRWWRR